jgi:hypothetical protein
MAKRVHERSFRGGDGRGLVMKEPAEVLPHGDTVAKNSAKQRAKMMPNSKRLSRLRLFCPESAGFTRKHGHLWQTAVRPCCRGMGRIAPPAGANRSTRWCESLHPLVRIAPPRPPEGVLVWAARTEQQPTNLRTHADQVQHPCRPPSASMLNRSYLFSISVFSSSIYVWGTLAAPSLCPNEASRPSGIFAP